MMLEKPMDVLAQFPVRKNRAQKADFREAVQTYCKSLGYPVCVEKGSFGSRNVIIGDPKRAQFLVTAHYDTCARLPFPNLITPCNVTLYIAYQLLITVLLFIPPVALGLAVGVLSGDRKIGFWAGYLMLWVILALIMVGPANKSNANDNTSGVVALLEIARSMPENRRNKVCFVLFDLEETGLMGSSSYRKAHKKETDRQIILNLDCVGEGDHILLFPTKRLCRDKKKLNPMFTCCGQFGNKDIAIRDKGASVYPSDQANFPYGVGICALNRGKLGLYMSRIHTPRDTVLDYTNINLLRSAIITYISCSQ